MRSDQRLLTLNAPSALLRERSRWHRKEADGSYLFDPEFEDIQKKITEVNARLRTEARSYVTVALLDLLTPTETSAKSAQNVRNELKGTYTAQRGINKSVISTQENVKITDCPER